MHLKCLLIKLVVVLALAECIILLEEELRDDSHLNSLLGYPIPITTQITNDRAKCAK
jgi:hypothetical protein